MQNFVEALQWNKKRKEESIMIENVLGSTLPFATKQDAAMKWISPNLWLSCKALSTLFVIEWIAQSSRHCNTTQAMPRIWDKAISWEVAMEDTGLTNKYHALHLYTMAIPITSTK